MFWPRFAVRSGFITLNRPAALNALSIADDPRHVLASSCLQCGAMTGVKAVAIRGSNKAGPFGAFCAGGDIRFFHQAADGAATRRIGRLLHRRVHAQSPDSHLPEAHHRLHGWGGDGRGHGH
jgi:enoyl-CoA hydratase/carnithine racemase